MRQLVESGRAAGARGQQAADRLSATRWHCWQKYGRAAPTQSSGDGGSWRYGATNGGGACRRGMRSPGAGWRLGLRRLAKRRRAARQISWR